MSTAKQDLQDYLQIARDSMLWKLDGLDEYDVRRPMTGTGTNLLGLIKHVASVEVGYFGDTFGRAFGQELPWWADDAETNADLYCTADESREQVLDLYRRATAHADETIATLDLDTVGHVPWWPADRNQVTLHRILVHVIAETNRHAGHADVVREMLDGAIGLRPARPNLPDVDAAWWTSYRERVEQQARQASGR